MGKGRFGFSLTALCRSFFSSFLFLPRLSRVGWVCQIRLIGRSQNATTLRSQIPQSVLLSIMGHSEGKRGVIKAWEVGVRSGNGEYLVCQVDRQTGRCCETGGR